MALDKARKTRYLVSFGKLWLKEMDTGGEGLNLVYNRDEATRYKDRNSAERRLKNLLEDKALVFQESVSVESLASIDAAHKKKEEEQKKNDAADKLSKN